RRGELELLVGPSRWIAVAMGGLAESVGRCLVCLLLLVMLRMALRRAWSAGAGVALVIALVVGLVGSPSGDIVSITARILTGPLMAWVLVRFGVLALVAGDFTAGMLQSFPIAAPPGSWYAPAGFFALASVAVLLVHALRSVLGGRPRSTSRTPGVGGV